MPWQQSDTTAPYVPTEEEIAKNAAAIREGWSEEEMARRAPHEAPVPVQMLPVDQRTHRKTKAPN